MTDLTRYADWTAWLRAAADGDPDVRCVWVSGSAATGGYDDWSDLDVDVLCEPGTSTAVYARWLARAREDFDVRDVWEMTLDDWPDGPHCFINLQDHPGRLSEPARIVDLHVTEKPGHTRIDVRRHGAPIAVHDPHGLLVLEEEDVSGSMATALDQVRQRRVTGEWLVNRAIERGQPAEALQWYLAFALEGVVRLLRARHCPWRHDFGLRYLREDLPSDVAERVEELVPGFSSLGLVELSARCFAWLDELLDDAS